MLAVGGVYVVVSAMPLDLITQALESPPVTTYDLATGGDTSDDVVHAYVFKKVAAGTEKKVRPVVLKTKGTPVC